jgi:hypothetical protein
MVTSELDISVRVRKIAQIIKLFSPEERVQLLELVPGLQEAETTSVLRESTMNYYITGLSAQREEAPMDLDAQFLGGLTYGDYLALSEREENAFWNDIFAEDVMDIDDYEEYDVNRNAYIPSR